MKLIIDVPDNYYKVIKEISDDTSTVDMLLIKQGIPLLKGHGRLIDANEAKAKFIEAGMSYESGLIDFVPTILEEDKEKK